MYKVVSFIFLFLSFNTHANIQLLDSKFGTNGITSVISPYQEVSIYDSVELDDNKILLVGMYNDDLIGNTTNGYFIGRLNSNGTLDTQFANQGFVNLSQFQISNNGGGVYRAIKVFRSSDGGFYVVGLHRNRNEAQDSVFSILISKHLENGQLNTNYGQQGIAEMKLVESPAYILNIQAFIDDKERIIATGQNNDGGVIRFLISRMTADGNVDTSFGNEGLIEVFQKATLVKENGISIPMDLSYFRVATNSENIVAVTQAEGDFRDFDGGYDEATQLSLHVYNIDGHLQNQVFLPDRDLAYPSSIALDSYNNVSLGSLFQGADRFNNIGILKFDFNGDAIATFGDNGLASFDVPQPLGGFVSNYLKQFIINDDGSYSLFGTKSGNDFFFIARMNKDGVLIGEPVDIDTGYLTKYGHDYKMLSMKDEGLLITVNGLTLNKIIRLNTDLLKSDSFVSQGRSFVSNFKEIRDLELLSDGSQIIVGYGTEVENPQALGNGLISKLNANGKIDRTFGNNGYTGILDESSIGLTGSETIFDVAVDSNENIAVSGLVYSAFGSLSKKSLFVTKLSSDGTINENFANSGHFTFDPEVISGSDYQIAYANSIQILNDQSIIAVGYLVSVEKATAIIFKLTPEGFLDNSFGVNGMILLSDDIGFSYLLDLIKTGADSFVAVGAVKSSDGNDMLAVKFNANGVFDQQFGNDGISIIVDSNSEETAFSVVSGLNGKLFLAGLMQSDSRTQFAYVISLTEKGNLDASFGNGGTKTINWGINTYNRLNSALDINLDANGNILVTGYADLDDLSGRANIGIAALRQNGQLIQSFGDNGTLNYHFENSLAWKVFPLSSNSLLIAGKGYGVGLVSKISGYNIASSNPAGPVTSVASSSGGGSINLRFIILIFSILAFKFHVSES